MAKGIKVDWEIHYKDYKAERMKELVDKMSSGMVKACLVVERQAKEDCPVDTGRLRASITSQTAKDGDKITGAVGTNVEYAAPVEFGTARRPATPFLFPAVEKQKGKIEGLLKE